MILFNILWPTFVLVALTFAMAVTTAVRRIAHVRRHPPARDTFAARSSASAYFAPVDRPADNLSSLFEMPVLFFALVPLLLLTRSADLAEVALAWIFVLLRLAHSYLHVVAQNVRVRFLVFIGGVAVLSAMWLGFLVDMIVGAVAISHAAGAMLQP